MVISCLYVQTVTRQCFCFPNSQWGVTAHDKRLPNPYVVAVHVSKYDWNLLRFLWGNHGPIDHDPHR